MDELKQLTGGFEAAVAATIARTYRSIRYDPAEHTLAIHEDIWPSVMIKCNPCPAFLTPIGAINFAVLADLDSPGLTQGLTQLREITAAHVDDVLEGEDRAAYIWIRVPVICAMIAYDCESAMIDRIDAPYLPVDIAPCGFANAVGELVSAVQSALPGCEIREDGIAVGGRLYADYKAAVRG
jgi:hypothetical protein